MTPEQRTGLRQELAEIRAGLAQWLAHGGFPPTDRTNRSRKKRGQPDG